MAEYRQVLRSDSGRVVLVSPLDIRYGPDNGAASIKYAFTYKDPSEGRTRTYLRQAPSSPWAIQIKVLKSGRPVKAPVGKSLGSLLRPVLRLIQGGGEGRRHG